MPEGKAKKTAKKAATSKAKKDTAAQDDATKVTPDPVSTWGAAPEAKEKWDDKYGEDDE